MKNFNGIIAVNRPMQKLAKMAKTSMESLRYSICGKLAGNFASCGDGVEKMNRINAVACGKLFFHFAGKSLPNVIREVLRSRRYQRAGKPRGNPLPLRYADLPLASCATGWGVA